VHLRATLRSTAVPHGVEACASSHHWSRELQAVGHTVRLMPPAYVKPYVKRQKNDATDAEAICEAVTRANMRFVPTKTPEQQGGLVLHLLHRTRHLKFLGRHLRHSLGTRQPLAATTPKGPQNWRAREDSNS
jgi:transposase